MTHSHQSLPAALSTQIEATLRQAGHRLTKTRRLVLQLLAASPSPVTAPLLQEQLAQAGHAVNKTTVYREIQFLQDQGLLRQIQLDSKQQYFELHTGDHHHHIRCLRCQAIADIVLPQELRLATEQIQEQTGFQVLDHSLEFVGVCRDCG